VSFRALVSGAVVAAATFPAGGAIADEIPANLVADIRIVEARSTTPNFQAMEELSFFIDSDGIGVNEHQWLATIARNVQHSFLATLVLETIPVAASRAEIEVKRRSRSFDVSLDLQAFLSKGVFTADVSAELLRSGESERSFRQAIELQLGKTYIWSGPGLEFSASEYLSYFRDYNDRDARQALYSKLREYTTYLVFAVTLRLDDDASARKAPMVLTLPSETVLPELASPLGIGLVGTIELELEVDSEGSPTDVRIVRSSLPEANPRLLGEADEWRFPEASGQTGRLVLELEAEP